MRTAAAAVLTAVLIAGLLSGCATVTAGTGQVGMPVHGDSGDAFDTQVKHALADVTAYWQRTYPTIAHGAALPPLRGGLYSVDGAALVATRSVPAAVRGNKCLRQRLTFIVDNAAYCERDDSIIWDRGAGHLLPVLTSRYGPTLTALVFAHEFGHAIQHRLHIKAGGDVQPIDIESQADCAGGAFAASALAGRSAYFHIDAAQLDRALVGYFQIRDSTPQSATDVTHGNGFDRINALQQGIQHGAAYCYSAAYLHDRSYTERGYIPGSRDYADQGNQPLGAVLGRKGIASDLNRFWRSAATTLHTTFRDVRLAQAGRPPCDAADATAEFGYCPGDNTVYYSAKFARRAYFSITDIQVNQTDATVRLVDHQPGDYALGFLLAVAWGMAARVQFAHRGIDDQTALRVAICDAGAYSEDINREFGNASHHYILSPPDMDEATSAVLSLVNLPTAFGSRGTTGLERVQAFVTGYHGGLPACR